MSLAQVNTAAEVITAVFAGVAVVITAIGGAWIRRTHTAVRDNVGQTNGQGTLAQMVARIDTRTTTMDERMSRMEARLESGERRFTAIEAQVAHRDD